MIQISQQDFRRVEDLTQEFGTHPSYFNHCIVENECDEDQKPYLVYTNSGGEIIELTPVGTRTVKKVYKDIDEYLDYIRFMYVNDLIDDDVTGVSHRSLSSIFAN
jgi:hypothetical protein